jgi:hypothetical protein
MPDMTGELLPMRAPAPGKISFRCPACRQWRPGFVFSEPTAQDVLDLGLAEGVEWICDNERTHLARAGAAGLIGGE